MKISELIAQLKELKKEHGDLEVRVYGDEMDFYYDIFDVEIETRLGSELNSGKDIFTDEFVAIN